MFGRGSGIIVSCDPGYPDEICYTYFKDGIATNVPGRYLGANIGAEVTSCLPNNTQIDNIFIYDNVTGDGSGYVSGLGCIDNGTNQVVFSPDTNITVENNYTIWYNTLLNQ